VKAAYELAIRAFNNPKADSSIIPSLNGNNLCELDVMKRLKLFFIVALCILIQSKSFIYQQMHFISAL